VSPGARKLSVLIPVLEASEELAGVHRETAARLDGLGLDYEFLYLVSTGSPRAVEQVRALHDADPKRVRVLQMGHSAGGSAMLAAGIGEAAGDLLLTLPPAYEVEARALDELVAAIDAGADLAFARRGPREGASARLQSRLFNRLISWAAGTSFTDVTTDTRAIRREVLQEIPLYGDFHRYLPVLAERVGFRVQEVSAREHPRASGYRYRAADYLWRGLDILSIFFLSRFTRRPLRLFGGVGSAFAAVGGVILVVVAFQRLFLGVGLADRPILVLSALLFGLGVQLFTIGLLGELILFFRARDIRDYRIAGVDESEVPALPARDPADRRAPGGASRPTAE
jgi:hypothetical protein